MISLKYKIYQTKYEINKKNLKNMKNLASRRPIGDQSFNWERTSK